MRLKTLAQLINNNKSVTKRLENNENVDKQIKLMAKAIDRFLWLYAEHE